MTTFVAGLRKDSITAPFVVDASMNGEIFLIYLEQCLVPTLSTGEIVMMDNLPTQEVAGVREAIEATGAMLRHFPPQSIEQSFAKLKAHLRKAAAQSPPFGTESETILGTVTPEEPTTSDTPGLGQTKGNPL